MRYAEKYDTSTVPPQPFLRIVITNPVTGTRLEERAYVDTGFSGSLIITRGVYERLNLGLLEVDEEYYAIHAGRYVTRLRPFIAELEVGRLYRRRKKIFLHPHVPKTLVGREVLNELSICLNGPRQVLELRD